jgi:hypothetical protein
MDIFGYQGLLKINIALLVTLLIGINENVKG